MCFLHKHRAFRQFESSNLGEAVGSFGVYRLPVYCILSPSDEHVILCVHTCQVLGLASTLKEGVKSLGDDNETVAMLSPKVLRELISPLSLGRRALFENPQGWGIRQICACSLALCRLTSCSGHLRSRGLRWPATRDLGFSRRVSTTHLCGFSNNARSGHVPCASC